MADLGKKLAMTGKIALVITLSWPIFYTVFGHRLDAWESKKRFLKIAKLNIYELAGKEATVRERYGWNNKIALKNKQTSQKVEKVLKEGDVVKVVNLDHCEEGTCFAKIELPCPDGTTRSALYTRIIDGKEVRVFGQGSGTTQDTCTGVVPGAQLKPLPPKVSDEVKKKLVEKFYIQ